MNQLALSISLNAAQQRHALEFFAATYTDIAAMLADTAVYSPRDLLFTQAEQARYKVAEAGMPDPHFTTAAGVKLYVQTAPDNTYHLDHFGAVGDGVHDDTPAFERFQQLALAHPNSVPARLTLTAGKHYTYTYNSWCQGFWRLSVFGNGARLECTAETPFSRDSNALNFGGWNSELGLSIRLGPDEQYQGDLMHSATAGAQAVRLVDPALAADYQIGDWVMIYGFSNALTGAPMDARYFEYRKVTQADPVTGDVHFGDGLTHNYNASWPKTHTFSWTEDDAGPPRALRLKRQNRFLTEHFEIYDTVFIRNRHRTSTSRLSAAGALVQRYIGCDMTDLVETTISSAMSVTLDGCTFGEIEGDKLTDQVLFKNCRIDSITQFVGTNSLIISDSTIRTFLGVASRSVILQGVTLDEVTTPTGSAVSTLNYSSPRRIESYHFDESVEIIGDDMPLWIYHGGLSMVVSNTDAQGNIVFLKNDIQFIDSLYVGQKISSIDGTAVARVIEFEEYDADNMLIIVEWLTPEPNLPVTMLHASHGTVDIPTKLASRNYVTKAGPLVTVTLTSEHPAWNWTHVRSIAGPLRLVEVEFDVTKASSVVGARLWIRNKTTNSNGLVFDLETAGRRFITAEGPQTIVGNADDTVSINNWTMGDWQINPRTGGNNSIVGPSGSMPTFTMRAVFATPFE